MTTTAPSVPVLPDVEAAAYADAFAVLAEPTRVRLLHAVATAPGGLTVGALTEALGISQSTCSHHVRKLADARFVMLRRAGTATVVSVNEACCSWLPAAADAVMGLLAPRPCCPEDLPGDVEVSALARQDWAAVRRAYADAIATPLATVETTVPTRADLDGTWLPGHRWVARLDGQVAGAAAASPVSPHAGYRGVAEALVCVTKDHRGRGVGTALIHQLVTQADRAGLWTLQATIITDNRAAIALYRSAGFRTVGVRERLTQVDGTWHDALLLERRTTQP